LKEDGADFVQSWYDIIRITNDELSFGLDDEIHDGETESRRPVEIDYSFTLTKD